MGHSKVLIKQGGQLSGMQNSSDVPGKPYRTSLRLNSTAQISKEALILTIVVRISSKLGGNFFTNIGN